MSRLVGAVLVAAVAWGGACAPRSAQRFGLPEGMELSTKTRDALDNAFGPWRMAAIDPQSTACLAGAAAPPPIVRGDFNGDGRPDIALAVKTADRVHLVAVLERVEQSTVVDVDILGLEMADGVLAVEPRGTAFVDPGGLQDFFSADTLAVNRCGQPRTFYLWSGLGFRKETLEAVNATSGSGLLRLSQHPL